MVGSPLTFSVFQLYEDLCLEGFAFDGGTRDEPMQVCEWHITEPLALVTTKKHDECAPTHDFPPSWIMRWIKSEGKRRREPKRMQGTLPWETSLYNDS